MRNKRKDRTVYDQKDLLHPSELTEGGRRLYSEDDLSKMRLICLLKSFGLSLDSIKGILKSDISDKVMLLLLDEREKQINDELAVYICPEYGKTFKPAMREFFFSRHTPKTRLLTCTACEKRAGAWKHLHKD